MAGVVHRAGEGEPVFGGRIVIKADFDQVLHHGIPLRPRSSRSRPALPPAARGIVLRLGRRGAFLVEDEERALGAGAYVCAPAGLVHGFRSTSPTRFLNVHTPAGGFASNLRALDHGEPGGFDSFDAPVGSGLPGSNAILLHAGEGEQLEAHSRIATIKIGRESSR